MCLLLTDSVVIQFTLYDPDPTVLDKLGSVPEKV